MKALVFSPEAASDINQIWDYTAEHWGPDQAERYTDDLRDVCCALAGGYRRGRNVDVRRGYLKCSVGTHVIYFQDQGDRLDTIRILHNRMDAGEHL